MIILQVNLDSFGDYLNYPYAVIRPNLIVQNRYIAENIPSVVEPELIKTNIHDIYTEGKRVPQLAPLLLQKINK